MRLPEEQKKDELQPQDRAAQDLPAALRGWLDDATGQMRWKRARPVAARELADHLTDQYEAFLDEGMDEDEAAQATAREMGDAVETGTLLDRAWRPRPDWVMLGIVLAVAAVGLGLHALWLGLPSYSGPIMPFDYVKVLGLGAGFLLAGYFLDYTCLGRNFGDLCKLWIAVNAIAILIWVVTVGQRIRPEHTLWLFPLVFAAIIYNQRGKGTTGLLVCARKFLLLYLPLLAYNGLMLLFNYLYIVYRPLEGDMLVITLVCTALLFGAVWRGWFGAPRYKLLPQVLLVPAVGAACTGISFLLFQLMRGRIASVLADPSLAVNPITEIFGHTYGQETVSMIRGVLFPKANEATGLMFADADYADQFLLICVKSRWGWLGFALLIAALTVLLLFGFRLAVRQSGLLATLVCHAVMLTLTVQVVLYVIQNLGIPLMEAPGLPLLSWGRDGVFLCQTMFLLGLLLSAQRSGELESGLAPCPAAGQAETMDRE